MTAADLTALDAVATGSPLSIGQARLWAQDRAIPCQIHTVLRLTGDLDQPALAAALAALVDRHELLRSGYQRRDGRPVRVVREALPVPLECRDLSAFPEAQRATTLRALLDQDAALPLPFDNGSALRATLLRLAATEHVLLLTVHRIACDDWSAGLLIDELAETYDAVSKGATPALPAPAMSYADFVAWQRDLTRPPTTRAGTGRRNWQACGRSRSQRTGNARPIVHMRRSRSAFVSRGSCAPSYAGWANSAG
jgi:hypothetical protein